MANTHSLDLEASSSQYAYVADQAIFDGLSAFSIECWLKFESIADDMQPLTKWGATNATTAWRLITAGGKLRLIIGDGTTSGDVDANQTITLGVWHHFAFTWDGSLSVGSRAKAYVNGVDVTANDDTLATMNAGTAGLYVGNREGVPAAGFYDGKISDVRLWNDVRTPAEIAASYKTPLVGNEANLIGYWKLNNNLLDSTSNGNNLIFSNYNTTATYTTRVDDDVFGYSTASKEKAAQPFVVTSNGTVNLIDVYYLAKNGSPTGNISAAIYSDSSGSPGTLLELASNTIDASTLPARGTAGPQSFQFSGTTYLSTSSTYWLVLSKSSLDTSNYCWWGIGSSGRPWPDYKVYSGGSWVAGSANYNFDFVLKGTPFSTDTPLDLTDSLVSYWKLDTNSNDSVASNNGIDTNVSYGTSVAKISGAVDTRSTSTSKIIIPDSASWDTETGNFSMACWAYQTTGTSAAGVFIGASAWTDVPPMKRYHLDMQGTGNTTISFGFYDGTNQAVAIYNPGASLRDGWHHIVGTRTGGVASIYVDGVLRTTASNTLGTSANCNLTGLIGLNIGIGNDGAGNWERFQGYIDEVGFWNRALNADEVTMLYNSGAGFTYPFTSVTTQQQSIQSKARIKTILAKTIQSKSSIKTINISRSITTKSSIDKSKNSHISSRARIQAFSKDIIEFRSYYYDFPPGMEEGRILE